MRETVAGIDSEVRALSLEMLGKKRQEFIGLSAITRSSVAPFPVPEYGHPWDGWSVECAGRVRQIRFCSADQIRFRTIVKRARMRATGKFSSWKNGRGMHWESPNERNAFCLLDFRSDVIAYREQSCEIIFLDDAGREATHFPDIEVLAANGHELWEVKTEYHANREAVSRRTDILTEALHAHGLTYRVAIAEELRKQPRLDTMMKVLRFGKRTVSIAERNDIARELAKGRRFIWGDACSGCLGPNGREILCRLVLEGFLQINADLPFNITTEFVFENRSSYNGKFSSGEECDRRSGWYPHEVSQEGA